MQFLQFEGVNYEDTLAKAVDHFKCSADELEIKDVDLQKTLRGKVKRCRFWARPIEVVEEVDEDEDDLILKEDVTIVEEEEEPSQTVVEVEDVFEDPAEYFNLSFEAGGVFVDIFDPLTIGHQVTMLMIERRLEVKKVTGVLKTAIMLAMQEKKTHFRVAPSQEEKLIDEQCIVKISKDKMTATVEFLPPLGGEKLNEDGIYNALAEAGVTFGIDKMKVAQLARRHKYANVIEIARGLSPTNGIDGDIKYLVKLEHDKKPTILEDGTADYFNLDLIENVTEGQIIGEITHATDGTPGVNVLGDEVPAKPGKAVVYPSMKNVEVSEDNLKILAMQSGKIELNKGTLMVESVYEIKGDVDLSLGNIEFNGDIIIRGSITTKLRVVATGNIEIGGLVEGGTIIADGNITLKNGIVGAGTASLKAGGDIFVKFVESATVIANGSVYADTIMHSTVECRESLYASGKKGAIVGGRIRVGREVIANFLGSVASTQTLIEAGVPSGVRQRLEEVEDELEHIEKEIVKHEQVVEVLGRAEQKGSITNEHRRLRLVSMRAKLQCVERRVALTKELEQLKAQVETGKNGRISAKQIAYPGVKLTIGSAGYVINSEISASTFKVRGGEIKLGPCEADIPKAQR